MKKIVLLLSVLLFSAISIKSQDIIDPPALQQVGTHPVMNPTPNKFILGWNWGNPGKRLDSALLMNSHHQFFLEWNDNLADSMHIIQHPNIGSYRLVGGRNSNYVFNAHSLSLEPTIAVEPTDDFEPRPGDNTGAIFGFQYRNFAVGDINSSGDDFGRFTLDKNSISQPTLVLSDIWRGDVLRWLDYRKDQWVTNDIDLNSNNDKEIFHVFNGKQWYFTINLRALEPSEINSHLNDTILVIKCPYQLLTIDTANHTETYSNGLVKFDSIPKTSYSDNFEIRSTINNHFRGIARKNEFAVNKPTVFAITGEMLKVDTSAPNNSITLSAFARFDRDTLPNGTIISNPVFQNDWWENYLGLLEMITEIDVEVIYHGNLDVAIDYIRIETPRAQEIYRGAYDETVSDAIDMTLAAAQDNEADPSIFRFYTNDEITAQQIGTVRYLNMLLDTLSALETFLHHQGNYVSVPHFRHATLLKEFWSGDNVIFRNFTSAPYIRRSTGQHKAECFYLFSGYEGTDDPSYSSITNFDVFNSQYETLLRPTSAYDTIPVPAGDSFYDEYYTLGTQHQIEDNLWTGFYRHPHLIFGDKPFWSNLWIQAGGWNLDSANNYSLKLVDGLRPYTGEEIRILSSSALLLGSKSFQYYKKMTDGDIVGDNMTLALKPRDNIFTEPPPSVSGIDYLKYSDSLGGDYIKLNGDPNGLNNYLVGTYRYDKLGHDTSRIYIGLESIRMELYRLHKFIKNNESTLLDLDLQAWYAKGFRDWYIQDPEVSTPDLLSNFIDYDNIKTQKIVQNSTNYVNNNVKFFESFDSTFVDVTLLKKESSGLSQVFYIGVQNRRTDPLVYFTENPADKHMLFLSTEEFNDLCDNGGKNPLRTWGPTYPAEVWQEYYWKRQGARRIELPFNFTYEPDPTLYCLLKVEELKMDDTYDPSWTWWRKDKFNRSIDTFITENKPLKIDFLPGEGKIFKVTVYPPDASAAGEMDYTNQTKMVAHPIMLPDGTLSEDEIRYHLVYHKKYQAGPNLKTGVFYKRSMPLTRSDSVTNIVWELEVPLSSSFKALDNNGDYNVYPINNAMYPSIVVRAYNSSVYAHVVYQLQDTVFNTCSPLWRPYPIYDFPDPEHCVYAYYPIIENRFDVNGGSINLSQTTGQAAWYVRSGKDADEWGHPVIGANAKGNFYAWSDSANHHIQNYDGIWTAFRPVDELENWYYNTDMAFNHRKRLKAGSDPTLFAKHPSLNPYSVAYNNFNQGEQTSSLVWEENNSNPIQGCDIGVFKQNDIFYTRLIFDDRASIIENFITTNSFTSHLNNVTYYPQNKLVKIVNYGFQTMPSVSRYHPRANTDTTQSTSGGIHECIVFRSRTCGGDFYPGLMYYERNITTIHIYSLGATYPGVINTRNSGMVFYKGQKTIYIRSNQDRSLTLSQGGSFVDSKSSNRYWERFNINYVYQSNIIQTPINERTSLLTTSDKYYPGMNDRFQYVGSGKTPQLAQYSFLVSDYWKNRRIFEHNTNHDGLGNPRLVPSLQLFYKAASEVEHEGMVGYSYGSDDFGFGSVVLDDDMKSMILPYQPVTDTILGEIYDYFERDSIYTDWFVIGNMSELSYKIKSSPNPKPLEFMLQKRSDMSTTNIPYQTGMPGISASAITLINGGNQEYRVLLVNLDTLAEYNEEMYLGGIETQDTINYKQNGNKLIIDLNNSTYSSEGSSAIQISCMPNPASDKILIGGYLPEDLYLEGTKGIDENIDFEIYNIQGRKLTSFSLNAGEYKEVDVSSWLHGSYIIKASQTNSYNSVRGLSMKTFIIGE